MTELADQELDLLKALANEWENSGPHGFLGTSAIEKELKLAIAETTSIIHSLFEKGIVGAGLRKSVLVLPDFVKTREGKRFTGRQMEVVRLLAA